jgi:hypothetical protein
MGQTEPHEQALSLTMPCTMPSTMRFAMVISPLKAPYCHNSGMLPSRLRGGQAALPMGRPAPFLASCGGVSQSATALATVDCSRLPTPRKNRSTSSSTSTRCYLLALGHLYHSLPTLYRCEQPPLPPEGVMPGLMCHTYANVFYSLQLTRTERLGTGSREGRLSYARRAYGVKNKMTHSAWKRRMSKGPGAASGFRSPQCVHQPRSAPQNPSPPRRENFDSRSASLFFARPARPAGKNRKICGAGLPRGF